MARLFISFLGTSPYVPCNYHLDDKAEEPQQVRNVRFIQTALLQLKCAHFEPGDRVLLGCTAGAREKNLVAFQEELSSSGWPSGKLPLEVIDLPDIASDGDLWKIFDLLSREVGEGDEIIFDITHSFRSLPMLFTILIQYLKVTRQVQLAGVHYGAFEKLGTPRDVEQMPLETRNAPILDLTAFLELFDWSIGIDRLIRSGDPADVVRLVDQQTRTVLKATKGSDDTAKALKRASSALDEMAKAISTVRGHELETLRVRTRITDNLQQVRDDFLPPLRPVIDKLTRELQGWEDASPVNVLRAVAWCHRHGQIQQGYTLLQEGIIGLIMIEASEELQQVQDPSMNEQRTIITRRTLISKLLGVLSQNEVPSPDQWRDELAEHRDVAMKIQQRIPAELLECYGRIKELRNDINHGGFTQRSKAHSLTDNLHILYQKVSEIMIPGKGSAD